MLRDVRALHRGSRQTVVLAQEEARCSISYIGTSTCSRACCAAGGRRRPAFWPRWVGELERGQTCRSSASPDAARRSRSGTSLALRSRSARPIGPSTPPGLVRETRRAMRMLIDLGDPEELRDACWPTSPTPGARPRERQRLRSSTPDLARSSTAGASRRSTRDDQRAGTLLVPPSVRLEQVDLRECASATGSLPRPARGRAERRRAGARRQLSSSIPLKGSRRGRPESGRRRLSVTGRASEASESGDRRRSASPEPETQRALRRRLRRLTPAVPPSAAPAAAPGRVAVVALPVG